MVTFKKFIASRYGIKMPQGNIPGSWFVENGLPMIVACTCCGTTMASPGSYVDEEGQCYCSSCADAEED